MVMMLKAARARAGLTQEQLAARLGVSRARIGNYEIQNRRPPLELAEQWATECGYTLLIRLLPMGEQELGELSPKEDRLLRQLRGLPEDQADLVFRLGTALPGHAVARESARRQIELLESTATEGAADSASAANDQHRN